MSQVTLWQSVSKATMWSSTLFTRKMDLAFLPDVGETCYFMGTGDEEAPGDSVAMYPKNRYWDPFGLAHIEFPQIIIDPNDTMPETPPRLYTYWWSDRDGDIVALLLGAGWERYP